MPSRRSSDSPGSGTARSSKNRLDSFSSPPGTSSFPSSARLRQQPSEEMVQRSRQQPSEETGQFKSADAPFEESLLLKSIDQTDEAHHSSIFASEQLIQLEDRMLMRMQEIENAVETGLQEQTSWIQDKTQSLAGRWRQTLVLEVQKLVQGIHGERDERTAEVNEIRKELLLQRPLKDDVSLLKHDVSRLQIVHSQNGILDRENPLKRHSDSEAEEEAPENGWAANGNFPEIKAIKAALAELRNDMNIQMELFTLHSQTTKTIFSNVWREIRDLQAEQGAGPTLKSEKSNLSNCYKPSLDPHSVVDSPGSDIVTEKDRPTAATGHTLGAASVPSEDFSPNIGVVTFPEFEQSYTAVSSKNSTQKDEVKFTSSMVQKLWEAHEHYATEVSALCARVEVLESASAQNYASHPAVRHVTSQSLVQNTLPQQVGSAAAVIQRASAPHLMRAWGSHSPNSHVVNGGHTIEPSPSSGEVSSLQAPQSPNFTGLLRSASDVYTSCSMEVAPGQPPPKGSTPRGSVNLPHNYLTARAMVNGSCDASFGHAGRQPIFVQRESTSQSPLLKPTPRIHSRPLRADVHTPIRSLR